MTWENHKEQGWYADQKARGAERRRERLRSAYHEAGHVYFGWLTGGKLVSVNVTPTKDASGVTAFKHPGQLPDKAWDDPDVQDYARTCLAGVCAQHKGGGFSELWDLGESGRQDVVHSMAFLVNKGWQGSNGRHWTQFDALDFFFEFSGGEGGPRCVVHEPGAWRCIEALALELLAKTSLTGREAVGIILAAWGGDKPLPPKALPLEMHGTKQNETQKED